MNECVEYIAHDFYVFNSDDIGDIEYDCIRFEWACQNRVLFVEQPW